MVLSGRCDHEGSRSDAQNAESATARLCRRWIVLEMSCFFLESDVAVGLRPSRPFLFADHTLDTTGASAASSAALPLSRHVFLDRVVGDTIDVCARYLTRPIR